MLRVRQKEIENSRKVVEVNNNVVNKLKEKLNQLGGYDDKGEPNWEKKYLEQLELKKKLEIQVKQLEKQNNN